MGTQVTKSCALTFTQCDCAVFYSFTSPPELGVHFLCPVSLAPGTALEISCLCNVLGEVSSFPTANRCKCGPLKL